jgi:S1-C subfamily serine protease
VTVRGSGIAIVALVCALLGATAALGIAKSTGWLDSGSDTIVLRDQDAASPAAQVETGASDDDGKPLPGNDFDPAAIYRERADGVVTVFSFFPPSGNDEAAAAQGSGFVVSDDGYILTNSHVITTAGEGDTGDRVKSARRVYVQFRDGDRIEADVVGYDLYDDVGVLKVDPGEHELRPVPLADSSEAVVGQPVAAIGSPFGQESSLSVGVVAATERSIDSLTSNYSLVDAIQTDAPINRGNSGGPLLDARGRALGINAQIRSVSGTAEGVGFAVPINSAIRSMEQLKETGRVRYAWVGITTQTVTPALARLLDLGAERGAAIQEVVEGSPAEAAGLEGGTREREVEGIPITVGGDLIVAIDGTAVESAEDVVRAVTERLPGETAVFTVVRDGERKDVSVKLGERPPQPPALG